MSKFVWHPTPQLVESANVTRFMRAHRLADPVELVSRSIGEQEWFWDAVVEDLGIEFAKPYHTVRNTERGIPWTDWYSGGELNIVANCVDRHASGPRADELCLIAEREDGTVERLTFAQLQRSVERCAAGLVASGVRVGDRVAAYMPMTAEVVIQLLATLKIGAVFIPIFSGYAPAAVAERLRDGGAVVLFTADATVRRGAPVAIEPNAVAAAAGAPSVKRIVVVRYGGVAPDGGAAGGAHAGGQPAGVEPDADDVPSIDWSEFLDAGEAPATRMVESMHPALILYTSGTTGRPKGTVHSHAGSLVQIAKETGYAFDLHPGERFFWLTDIGWMMGPWQIIGGLFHAATVVIYDGAFDWPGPGRLWEMLERHRVSVFGISPTAIRLAMRREIEELQGCDLSSLRILGSTGEPWDEASWLWYFQHVGGGRCPIINISGGTDIIGCFLSPLPLHSLKPCTLVGPGLGMAIDVWNQEGRPVRGEVGYLVATQPAPSMTRGLWNDRERYLDSYWSTWPDVWNHGDWALIDEDGYWFLQGRADDTLKVAGRRIGPAEIEGALIATGAVSEAAAIGVPHEIKGESIVCFAVLKPGREPSDQLRSELAAAVVEQLGKIDRPDEVLFVDDLPKTRSAKILRRLVRAKYLGEEELGDLSSVQNPESLAAIEQAK